MLAVGVVVDEGGDDAQLLRRPLSRAMSNAGGGDLREQSLMVSLSPSASKAFNSNLAWLSFVFDSSAASFSSRLAGWATRSSALYSDVPHHSTLQTPVPGTGWRWNRSEEGLAARLR